MRRNEGNLEFGTGNWELGIGNFVLSLFVYALFVIRKVRFTQYVARLSLDTILPFILRCSK